MDEVFEKLEEKVGAIAKGVKEIFIWGAGNTALLYAPALHEENIRPVAFVDSHAKVGDTFLGQSLIPPCALAGKEGLVLICSQNPHMVREISQQIEETIHLPYLTVNEYIFFHHMKEIEQCITLMEDELSKKIYNQVLTAWIKSIFPPVECYYAAQYFSHPRFMEPDANEVFVDLGAFVGDTIERFLFAYDGTFKKIIAFEPDSRNFAALCARMRRLEEEWAINHEKRELVQAGAGRKTSVVQMEQSGNGRASKVSADCSFGDNKCQIFALDDYFEKESITFLKADIESSEYDMLLGAERVIRRDMPKLAISIYHNPLDMFRIPLWLHSLNLDYKFAIRHHSVSFADTVLYAYGKNYD